MDRAKAASRLGLSEATISRYEAMGGPTGALKGNLLMIRDELAILAGIAREHPTLAERVKALEYRYSQLSLRLTLGMH